MIGIMKVYSDSGTLLSETTMNVALDNPAGSDWLSPYEENGMRLWGFKVVWLTSPTTTVSVSSIDIE